MRASEFITENASVGATSSGNVATVPAALGGVIRRSGGTMFSGKYSNSATPNTPAWMKRLKGKNRA